MTGERVDRVEKVKKTAKMAKITRISAERYDLSLIEPFRISLGTITKANNVIVKIFGDSESNCSGQPEKSDLYGIGEGSPTYKITGDDQDGSLALIRNIATTLVDQELDIQRIDEILNSFVNMTSAKAAISIAIYDLLGKELSKPLFRLLGGYRREIETDITIGILPAQEVRKKALDAISRGFKTLKIKIEGDVEKDLKRVRAVGDLGVKIRLDANQGFTPKKAVQLIRKLNELEIELIEQPVPFWDIDGMRYVRENSDIPIFADESAHLARDALNLVRKRCVDGVNIKLMKCGGISEAIKIINIAEAAGIPCMIGCMLESKISLTAAAHLALAFKNIRFVDLDSHLFLKSDPVSGGMEIKDGRIVLPDSPGLGITGIKTR